MTRLPWKISAVFEYCAGKKKKREHRLLEEDHRAAVWYGRRALSSVCPHCNCFPLDDYMWCAACGGQHDWRAPNRILVVQLGANATEAKEFRAHEAPPGLCDNLVNTLKMLANQQKDGDSPIQSIVTGLHERSRRGIVDGQELHCGGQPQCGGGGRVAPRHNIDPCSKTAVQ